jgi:hypothetical protein
VSGLLAARVAARLRRDLEQEVVLEHGDYGEFTVLVDGDAVIRGGPMAMLAVLPRYERILEAVRARLGEAS